MKMNAAPEIHVSFDPEDHEILSIYIRLTKNKVSKTVEIGPECNLDLDSRGRVVGAEIMAPCKLNIIEKVARSYKAPMLNKIAPYIERLCPST